MRTRAVLAALAGSTFFYVTTETLPIGLLPQLAGGLGVSVATVGLLVTGYGLVVVLVTIPLTRLTDHWPRRRLLGTLLLVATAATVLSALAPNYATLLGGRVLTALSQAVFWAVVTPAAAALVEPAARGRAISVVYAGSSAGPMLGVPAGTWLGQQAGWRLPFLALAVLGLAVSAVILLLMPDLPPGSSDAERGSAPDRGRYGALVVVTAVTVTGAFTAFTCVSSFLTDVGGISDAAVGPVLFLRGAAGLLGALAAGFLVSRHAWRTMVLLVGGQALALTVQYLWSGNAATAVLTTATAGMVLSGLTTVLATRVLQLAPGSTNVASAGVSTAFNLGITAGALVGSYLLATADVRHSPLTAAVITVGALATALAEPRLSSRRTVPGRLPESGSGQDPLGGVDPGPVSEHPDVPAAVCAGR